MKVRPALPADYHAIRDVLLAAFAQDFEANLVEALRDSKDTRIEFVAQVDGIIVGHLLLSKMAAPAGCLGLAPVAVAPDRQGQGVGSALMRAAIDGARRGRWNAIFLLGDPAYYGRFGFSVEDCRIFESAYPAEYMHVLALREGALDELGRRIEYAEPFNRDFG